MTKPGSVSRYARRLSPELAAKVRADNAAGLFGAIIEVLRSAEPE